jgi:glycosyltransferase involved in cell wall biosynthesis
MIINNPLVSICIPTYNGAQYIVKCIESALTQTYENFEIIINDDGSNDDTVFIVKGYTEKDGRVKLFQNEINRGLVENWNTTLNLSSGEYIKWLFQDDWMEPNAIEEFVAAANKGYDFIISKRNFILSDAATADDKDYFFNRLKKLENHFPNDESYHYFTQKEMADFSTDYIALNFIAEPSLIFFKKSLLNTVGLYDKLLHQICDLEHSLRLASVAGIYVINKPLCHFAIHLNSATNSNLSKKYFQLRFTEQAYYAYKLLNDSSFNSLRKYFSFKQKLKLKLYYMFRIHEAKQYIAKQTDPAFYNNVLNEYPFLKLGIMAKIIFGPVFFTIDTLRFWRK